MKDWREIPECNNLLEEMFKKWDEIPRREGGNDLRHERIRLEIEKVYIEKIREAIKKYQIEHPQEIIKY